MPKGKYKLLMIPALVGIIMILIGLYFSFLPGAQQYKDIIIWLTITGFVIAFLSGGIMWVVWRTTFFFALLESMKRSKRK